MQFLQVIALGLKVDVLCRHDRMFVSKPLASVTIFLCLMGNLASVFMMHRLTGFQVIGDGTNGVFAVLANLKIHINELRPEDKFNRNWICVFRVILRIEMHKHISRR